MSGRRVEGRGAVPGVGLDLVAVERIRRILARSPGFWGYFHGVERRRAEASADPARVLATAFAVKEAALKALGRGVFDGVALPSIVHRPARGVATFEGRARAVAGVCEVAVTTACAAGFVWALAVVGGGSQAARGRRHGRGGRRGARGGGAASPGSSGNGCLG